MSLSVRVLPADVRAVVEGLSEKLAELTPRNKLRSDYYDAKRMVRQVGTTIPAQYENLGLVLGWASKSVDGLARRCNLDGMVWADGDLNSLGMRELAAENLLFSEFSQARTDSLLHGVSFLVTTQGLEGEAKALVHAKSALDAVGDWNPRTRRLDSVLSVTDRGAQGEITSFALYQDGLTTTAWLDGSRWKWDQASHSFGMPVDALRYRPRSSRRMGRSRISRPVMRIQDAAVRALVRLEAHMDIYTIPKLVMLGADESIFLDASGAPKQSWQVVMGRIFGIPDDDESANPRADIKQFAAESPEPHLAQLNAQAKLMARETDLPDTDFALSDMAVPTSAESYTASRENLIAEAEGATDDWSPDHRSTVARALAIRGGLKSVPDAWASIDTKWRSPIYLSKAAAADAGAKQLAAGPEWLRETRVGLELLGLSEQQIDLALSEREAAERLRAGRAVVEALTNGGRNPVEGGAAVSN